MTTDTSELGLERLVCTALTGSPCDATLSPAGLEGKAVPSGGGGWICGNPQDYDREFCVDRVQLAVFLKATQPEAAESLDLGQDSPTRRKFLARLQGEISKRGVIDVLRKGVKDGPHHVELFYGTSSPYAIPPPLNATPRTASRSHASSATAVMRPSARSTSACSSMACRSPRSS